MNVGITCYPTYGGSGIVATELGLELANRGHEVHFITYANPIRLDPGHPADSLPRGGSLELSAVPVSAVLPGAGLAHGGGGGGLRARSAARALRHPAFHLGAAGAADAARRRARCPSSPRCTAPISRWWASTAPISRSRNSPSSNRTASPRSATICGSRRWTFSAWHNEIRVIKNFVNCDLYQPDEQKTRAARFAPAGDKLLIHVSNFRPVKRVLDCIRILAEVRKRAPAHLLMVGDGPERGPAEHLARDLQGGAPRELPGQAGPRGAADPAGARAADAERTGSRSGWPRWRRWHAACRRWPRVWAACPS